MIVETFQLTASDSDVLKAPSRLAAIPSAGVLRERLRRGESLGPRHQGR